MKAKEAHYILSRYRWIVLAGVGAGFTTATEIKKSAKKLHYNRVLEALQQLEKIKLVKKLKKLEHDTGSPQPYIITNKGQSYLDAMYRVIDRSITDRFFKD